MGSYHHGNLRHDLIEAGIELLGKCGEEALSLRAVAAACHVSHAAPYNHFADKGALLYAMEEAVIEQLLDKMESAVNAVKESCYSQDGMFELACAYVRFFNKNPYYYSLLFLRRGAREPKLMLRADGILESSFLPFLLFQSIAEYALNAAKAPPTLHAERILEMWTAMQGVTALFVLEHFACPDREGALKLLLRSRMHIK